MYSLRGMLSGASVGENISKYLGPIAGEMRASRS